MTSALTRQIDRAGCWAAAALGVSILFSVALHNVLLAACLAAWLLGGSYREKFEAVRTNPVVVAALALFALLAAGLAWGERYPGDAAVYLGKYQDLLFVALFVYLLRDATVRLGAIYAFAGSLGAVLVLSYLIRLGIVPAGLIHSTGLLGDPGNPIVLKHHLTHNILMAYGAFLFAELALAARTARIRALLTAAALAAAVNVLFMVQGRTGYLVLAALALYWGYGMRGWRGLAVAAAVSFVTVAALALVPGTFHERWQTLVSEFQSWRPGAATQTSTGSRLEFYRNSLEIVREHPLLGVGTGGFPKAYDEKVRGTDAAGTRNPHNEYLHIAAQIGLAGLALLLCLFYVQWRCAARLGSPLELHLARGLTLTIAVGCLFNSLLLDHTEGLMFAWLTGVLYAGLGSGKKEMENRE